MDGSRVAPLVGIVGCGLVLLTLLAPYLGLGGGAVGTYYAAGALNPLVGGLFAAVTVIVLAAGHSGRTDPATAAGVGLVFGVLIVGVSLAWSLTIPESIVFQLATTSLIEIHRWVLALVSLVIPVSGAWYARALALV